jgi:EAL domain-containing protein (putative c-di-GMP-specific phosphodiesterase class I)
MFSIPDPSADGFLPVHVPARGVGRAEAARRRRLRQELATTARRHGFVLHYQPRLALDSGERVGLEALLRWPRPRSGVMPAADFLPLAEESGLITEIGGWVLLAACREAMRWPAPWMVSVNVSPRQLTEGALLGQVAAALELSGLDPERLELEVAEPNLLGFDVEALLALSAIRDLGAGIGMDNFGTGLASLSMLKRLPLTTMKIDRSLVRDLPRAVEDAAIVRAIVATADALGLTVVAEGIETEAQRAFLADCGCRQGQGYLFGHLLAAEALRPIVTAA